MRLYNQLTAKHALRVIRRRGRPSRVRRLVLLCLFGLACTVASLAVSKTLTTQAHSLTASLAPIKLAAVGAPQPTSSPAPTPIQASSGAATPAVSSSVSAAVVPQCIPDTSYSLPTEITPTQPGLVQVIDTPSTYSLFGNTPAQIMAQMTRCTPVQSSGTGGFTGTFAASTANTISWQITSTDNGSGVCSVTSVAVTLHINQVFPEWQPSSGSPSGLNAEWQTYSTKLHAYEQGHVQLDEAAANAVLSDLQTLPATACGSIDQVANTKANADLASYLSANANYDTTNDFGLKEDVVL